MLVVSALASPVGCQETTTRVVNLHVTASCPIPTGSVGEYVALGDYNPSQPNHSSLLATDQAGQTIDGVPADVQSLALVATASDDSQFFGVTLVPPAGDVDMLLLPSASACKLNTKVGFAPGMIFGAVTSSTIIASGTVVNQAEPQSFRIDLGTGQIDTMQNGLQTPRVRAALAMLGSGGQAVVSGGVSNGITQKTAEIFDQASGGFEPSVIQLAQDREDHAAVTLESGNVLLVGGQNDQSMLIAPTELISLDAVTGQWRSAESTVLLAQPRKNPYALRLADGTILVGGGYDENDVPIPDVEFFTPDATATEMSTPNVRVPARPVHAFVALDGGGALFVAAPDRDPPDFQRAWFVSPDGGAVPIVPDVSAPLSDVKLFARAGGQALLWTGSTWLLFDPWSGFSALANAPSSGPDLGSPFTTPDPGMVGWVASDGSIVVWRDATRNEFATEGPYLSADTTLTAADHWPPPTFDATTGVALDPSESVFVTDARYLDVAVDVDGAAGNLPIVVMRGGESEVDVGGGNCPLPFVGSSTHLHVERHGAFVSFSLGGPLMPCGPFGSGAGVTITSAARIAVGVRGGGAGSQARNLMITRLGPAG